MQISRSAANWPDDLRTQRFSSFSTFGPRRCAWRASCLFIGLMLIAGCTKESHQPKDILNVVRCGSKVELGALISGGIALCGGDEEVSLVEAAYNLRMEKFDRSLKDISRVNPNGRFRVDALWIAGESLYRMGNTAAALPLLTTLIKEMPDHVQGRKCLAAIYYDLGAMENAKTELKQVCNLDSTDYRPYALLGRICLDFSDYEESIGYFNSAFSSAELETQKAQIEPFLAQAMCRSRHYEDLLNRQYLRPDDAIVRTCCAEALWSTGKASEARRLIDAVLASFPEMPETLLLSARLHSSSGEPKLAIQQLERILRADHHNVLARNQLALAFRQIGDEKSFQENMALFTAGQELQNELVALNAEVIKKVGTQSTYDRISEVCTKLGKIDLAEHWRKVAAGIGRPPLAVPAERQ